jgi:L-Ala-D/L-Glu epimerase
MKLQIHSFQLQLKHAFNIARDSYSMRDNVIVELLQDGHSGLGEAITHSYYNVTKDNIMAVLTRLKPKIEAYQWGTPEDFWAYMADDLRDHPFVQCALDQAAWDLYAKLQHKPLYKLWNLNIDNIPLTDYTIGIDTIEVMIQKMKELPFPLYKIKLGTPHDIDIIKALRAETDALFRVDANCGWGVDETLQNAQLLRDLGVEFIEQPMKAGENEGMETLFQHCTLPLIADESCIHESDVAACANRFHGINIKLVKCGGLTPALRMIAEARALDMKVMVGCMTESSIGIAAIAHLLPLLDYVDMDGALLLNNDPAEGVGIEYGKITFANRNGTGGILKDYQNFRVL